eukprot:CAMPEP_0172783704 /NCGR_PEP_ID=MMETSP1074-20121228/204573_1 /TAXON_ID=2916 /ORGANISM="Ceratium fusus, Strain PA161109" /LENGTH=40 /DNA_ID= /DNA_START= /DNA_END= /DNA_ORIENTATION=
MIATWAPCRDAAKMQKLVLGEPGSCGYASPAKTFSGQPQR